MKWMLFAAVLVAPLVVCTLAPAHAGQEEDQSDYCKGFAEGFRSVRSIAVPLPACAPMPAVPDGSTPFREGLKDGIRAGRATPAK
jgi:hypothetical protein